jgi:hypothetical protein
MRILKIFIILVAFHFILTGFGSFAAWEIYFFDFADWHVGARVTYAYIMINIAVVLFATGTVR